MRTPRGLSCLLVCLLVLPPNLLLPALAWAQQPRPAGVVTALKGQATVARATLPRPAPLRFKDDVFFQDKVITERDSVVKVLLGGKALVTIRELSDFTIVEGPNKSTVNLGLGRLALQVLRRLMRPGEEIEIRTPNAIAAVRGSFVVVDVQMVSGVPTTNVYALTITAPVTVTSTATGASVTLSSNTAVALQGTGAATRMSPVITIPPAQARELAKAAEAPRQDQHNNQAPGNLTAKIGGDKIDEAGNLARALTGEGGVGFVLPPPPPPPPPPPIITSGDIQKKSQESVCGGNPGLCASQTPVIPVGPFFLIDSSTLTVPAGSSLAQFDNAGAPQDPIRDTVSNQAGTLLVRTRDPVLGFLPCEPSAPCAPVLFGDKDPALGPIRVIGDSGGPALEIRNSTLTTGSSPLVLVDAAQVTATTLLSLTNGSRVTAGGPLLTVQYGGAVSATGLASIDATSLLTLQATGAVANLGGSSGSFPITNAGTLQTAGNPTTFPSGVPLSNTGTVTVQGGTLSLQGGGSSSGTFTLSTGASVLDFAADYTLSGGSITGLGTTQLTGGATLTISGTTTIATTFNDPTSTVNVTGGTLSLTGGGSSTGAFTVASGTVLQFGGGTASLTSSSSVSGAGTVDFSGGTTTVAGTYNITGSTTVSGGTANFNAGATVTSLGPLTISAGTAAFSTGSAIAPTTFAQSGGTFTGGDDLSITGSLSTWSGGTQSGSGTSTVQSGATFALSGSPTLDTRTLGVLGTATLTGAGALALNNSGLLSIGSGGTFDIQSNAGITAGGGTPGTITVASGGTFQKSGGAGASTVGAALTNSGTIRALSGMLALTGGVASSGTYEAASGAIITLPGPLSGTFATTGAGRVEFVGAVVNAPVTVSGPSGTLSLGGLTGTSTFTIAGGSTFTWSVGNMSGTGNTIVAAGASLIIASNFLKGLDQRSLTLAGTATVTGQGDMNFSNGASLTIQNGGLFDLQADANLSSTGGQVVVNPGGIFQKSGGTGFSDVFPAVTNSGTVGVQSGTLLLAGGGTDTGTFTVASGATLRFGGGTHNLNAGSSLAGAGAVTVTAGTVNFSGAYRLTGTTTVSGGTLAAPGDLVALSSGTLSPAGTMFAVTGSTLNVAGDLVAVGAGATLTPGGPLLTLNGPAVTATIGGDVLDVAGTLTGPAGQPLINVAASSGSPPTTYGLTVSGALANLAGSDTTLSGPILTQSGGSISAGTGLILAADASLAPTGGGALFQVSGGGLSTTGDLVLVTAPSNPPTTATTLTLAGPLFTATGGSNVSVGNFLLDVESGATVSNGTDTNPFIQVVGTGAPGSTILTTPNSDLVFVVGTGAPGSTTLSLAGPLFRATNGADTSVGGVLLDAQNGAAVTGTGSGAFLQVDGTGSTLTIGSDVVFMRDAGTALNLAGPLLSVTAGGTVTGCDDCFVVLDIGNGATVTGTGAAPFIRVAGGTISGPWDIALVNGPGSALNLAGPFLSVTAGSTITSCSDCFNILDIEGGATVTGTGAAPFIQVADSTLTNLSILAFLWGSGTKLTLSGPLASVSGTSTVNIGSSLALVQGGAEATLGGPLLTMPSGGSNTPTVNVGWDVLNVDAASTFTGPVGQPLINVAAPSATLNVTGALANLAGSGTTLSGPLLTQTGGSISAGTGLGLATGATLAATLGANKVVATVGVASPFGVAITPDGTRAYVANFGANTVSVLNAATNTVIATVGVGTGPLGVALAPDGTRAYVANNNVTDNSVSVIDTATNTVIATVGVGSRPRELAVAPNGSRVYVSNGDSNTVSVIDTATNTVLTGPGLPIPVGSSPDGVAISPNGSRAYVANINSNTVSVIDTATNTVIATVGVGSGPHWVTPTPDGARAYVTNTNSNTVSVIDTATNTVIATVGVGPGPAVVAITPDGTRAYVSNNGSNTVSVIDTATNTVIATVGVGSAPDRVAITPDGTRAYVSNNTGDTLSVIGLQDRGPFIQVAGGTLNVTNDLVGVPAGAAFTLDSTLLGVTGTGSVTAGGSLLSVGGTVALGGPLLVQTGGSVSAAAALTLASGATLTTNLALSTVNATVPVGASPFGIGITPDGSKAYVANEFSATVSVINTATNTVVNTVSVGAGPVSAAVTPNGAWAYVPNWGSSTVSVIDTATNNVTTVTDPSGAINHPQSVAITPDGTRAYVTNTFANTVSVIDTATNTVIGSPVAVGTYPFAVAISRDGARAYVVNAQSNSLSIIDTATNIVIGPPVTVGANPNGVAVTPDGTRAYVANTFSNTVSVIDTGTQTVIATIPVGTLPKSVAITPDGRRAYVINENSNTVSVIDVASNQVIATLGVNAMPHGLAITPDGTRVYLAHSGPGVVSVLGLDRGPFIQVLGGTLTTTGNLVNLQSGAVLTLDGGLLAIGGTSDVQVGSSLVSVDRATLTTTSPAYLINLHGNSGPSLTLATGGTGSLLLGTTSGLPADATITLQGGLLNATNATITLASPNSDVIGIFTGATLTSGTSSPLVDLTNTTLTVGTAGTLFGRFLAAVGTGGSSGTTPATVGLQGGLLSASGGTLTTKGHFLEVSGGGKLTTALDVPLVRLSGTTVDVGTPGSGSDVFRVNAATAELAGSLLQATNSSITPSGSLLNVFGGGVLTSSTAPPLISLDPSTVLAPSDLVRVNVGSTLSLAGPLLAVTNSTVTVGEDLLEVLGALISTSSLPLVSVVNSSVSAFGLWRVCCSGSMGTLAGPALVATDSTIAFNGGVIGVLTFTSTTSAPLISLTNSSLSTPSLLGFCCTATPVSLAGALAAATGSAITLQGSAIQGAFAPLTSTTTDPFVQLSGGSFTLGAGASALTLDSGTMTIFGPFLKATGTTLTVAKNIPFVDLSNASSLSAGGPFLDLTNVNLDLGAQPVARLRGGSTLTNTAGPVFRISGGSLTADALVILDSTGNTLNLTGTPLDLTNTTVTLRTLGESVPKIEPDPETVTFTLGPEEPFLRLANSTLTAPEGGGLAIDPVQTGPIFQGTALIADNSTVNLGDGLVWLEGTVSVTGTDPLVQLTGSTLNMPGPSSVIGVEGGAQVTLAKPLLRATGGSTVNTVNPNYNSVAAPVPVGSNPYGVALSPDGGKTAYVANRDSDTVSIIDTRTNTVTAVVNLNPLGGPPRMPLGVAVAPDGKTVYVANSGNGTVSAIDTTTRDVTNIAVGGSPSAVATSFGTSLAIVTNTGSTSVSIIETNPLLVGSYNTVVGTVSVGAITAGAALSGSSGYVSHAGSTFVSAIDTVSRTVIGLPITVGSDPEGVALVGPAARAYVANRGDNTVTVLNTLTWPPTVIATISDPDFSQPSGIAVTQDGTRVYVTNRGNGKVSVIDAATNKVVTTLTVAGAVGLAMAGDGSRAYVTQAGGVNSVSAVDVNPAATVLSIGNPGGGATLISTGSAPLLQFSGGTVTIGNLARIEGAPSGPGSLALAGSLLDATDTTFTTVPERSFIVIRDGAIVTGATPDPFLRFTGTAPGASKVTAGRNFLVLYTSWPNSILPPPSMTLSGPLLDATLTDFKTGDSTKDTHTFVFVADGALLRTTGTTDPLLKFTDSSVDTAGNILTLRRSWATPSTVDLSGPLFVAQGGTFNTTSLGFGSACCSGFHISQGGMLKSAAAAPLIQLANSAFNSADSPGPGNQSGGNFFSVSDSAPHPGELVAPASVILTSAGGSLLKATDSTITSLFSLLDVVRSTFSSSGTGPLIEFVGTTGTGSGITTVTLGGTDPFTGPTSGHLLYVKASENSGTAASAASVSLNGGLLLATNSNLTTTDNFIRLKNGATLTSNASPGSAPLIQLANTALSVGNATNNGHLLRVDGTGGPGIAGSSVTLNNLALLSATGGSNLNITAEFAHIDNGGQVTVTGTSDPFVSLTGGTHNIGIGGPVPTGMFLLGGSATGFDPESNLWLGTDQPLRGPASGCLPLCKPLQVPLLETSGAVVNGQNVLTIDTALLEASAPLLNLTGGATMTTTTGLGAINLANKANLNSTAASLVRLDASTLNILNGGSLFNVAGGSKLKTAGDLLAMNNATLNILNGFLLSVSGGSFVSITGSLVNFTGTANTINVTNGVAPTGYLFGIPVFSSLGGTNGFNITNANALNNYNATSHRININGTLLPVGATTGATGSLVRIGTGGGTVKIQ